MTGSAGEEPCGTISVSYVEHLRSCEVVGREIASLVDEIPVLALVAAHAEGTTVFHEVGELRVKETDRLAAILEGLSKLGVHAWAEGDDLHIGQAGSRRARGGSCSIPGRPSSRDDLVAL